MPARDPSAAPMAHLSASGHHHHQQRQKQHHPESGLSSSFGAAGQNHAFGGRRGSFPSSALLGSAAHAQQRPTLPPSTANSTDGVIQHSTLETPHDASTGRSRSISGPMPTMEGDMGPRRRSLWQSISGMTGAVSTHQGKRSSSEDDVDAPWTSGVVSPGGAPGSSGWFSSRGDNNSLYSTGEDAHPAASASLLTDSENIRNASMGLAASLSYTSGGSGSLPPPHRPPSHLGTVIGGISPEDDPSQPDEDSHDDGLSTIRESSRSSSNVNLLTPRVSLGGKALAGLEDSPSSAAGDISPKNGSLPSSGPSGLSLMLNRSVPSPKKKEKKVRKREVAGTDKLASGASGALGILDFPEDEEKDGEKLGDSAGRDTDSSVASSLTVRPGMRDTLHPSSQSNLSSSPASSPDIHEHTANERTPLLSAISETHHLQGTHSHGKPHLSPDAQQKRHPAFHSARENVHSAYLSLRKATWRDVGQQVFVEPVKLLPATILGCLLNVLDGVSYGMIMFPASPIFDNFGSLGVSMFFVSCIISQLTYTLGGSIFKGGNGSMMIEAVPFFHILTNIITDEVGDDPAAIISTTMMSYAFSAVLTGLVFLSLGYFKLGALIGYFPRHILVGCIGGVGVFLLETGLEVSRGLKEEGFEYNLNTLRVFFANGHAIALWTIPLALAIILRIITHRFHHQLIFPSYFFVIPCVFYIVILIGGWSIAHLRQTGWIFDVGGVSQPWYTFYTLFDLRKFSWKAFWSCIPTQMALVFFGILHVPLNVPALGVSLQEDNVDLDRELVAHGISNMGAGLLGTVPNYLCYVNTVLFYRVGGGSRLSGLMLAAATGVIMMIGPSVIAYLPVMVVGALIFVLGIDLVKEAVWDTRHRVNKMEYITIWAITIGMTLFDFVIGLLLGIILASMFFVIQNSRRRPIRAVFSGSSAKSTVRRPHPQRAFLQAVGKQTLIMKLQGFLFFGTITKVEEEIRKLLDMAAWESNPIRFLIVDFALVPGLDFSSAEAFVRLQRLLSQKDVLLILCGANPDGLVGRALQAVDLWADQEGTRVEVFDGLNSALEWCENAYLTAFYASNSMAKRENDTRHGLDVPAVSKPPFAMSDSHQNSPRRTHLAAAGVSNLPFATPASPSINGSDHKPGASKQGHQGSGSSLSLKQPLPILLQTFSDYFDDPSQNPHDFFYQIVPYLSSVHTKAGQIIFQRDDAADALYLIESGCLRATYEYEDHCELIQETMVAGTVAGELTMLSASKRNATLVAERDSKLWKLDQQGLEKMEKERPEIARRFIKIVLKVANEEADVLFNHLVAVLS